MLLLYLSITEVIPLLQSDLAKRREDQAGTSPAATLHPSSTPPLPSFSSCPPSSLLCLPPVSAMASGASGSGAAAGAASAPVFVLDALRHTDPLPGPVWRDRLFCSYVGDAYMESTELQGMDQKRGGDMGPLLAVLAFLAEQTRNERAAELAAVGVDEQGMRALDKVIQIFKTRSVKQPDAPQLQPDSCSRALRPYSYLTPHRCCTLSCSVCLLRRHCKPSTRRISSLRSVGERASEQVEDLREASPR